MKRGDRKAEEGKRAHTAGEGQRKDGELQKAEPHSAGWAEGSRCVVCSPPNLRGAAMLRCRPAADTAPGSQCGGVPVTLVGHEEEEDKSPPCPCAEGRPGHTD